MEKRSVCVVDDDKIFQFTTKKYLEFIPEVSRIFSFKSVGAALDYIKENLHDPDKLPDILLLDVNLPVMDGWDFVAEYQEFKSELPKNIFIFMVSSSIDERDSQKALEHPEIIDYVIKPMNENRLKQLVHQTFEK